MKPPIREFASEAQAELQDLVTRRRQLVEMLTAEQNRLSGLRGNAQTDVEVHLDWLRERIQQLEAQIEPQISQCQTWQTKQARLKSVPGVGKVVAATFLALLPELGSLSTQKISTLVGVAPLNRDSGPMQGKRTILRGSSGSAPNVVHGNLSGGAPQPSDSSVLCSVNRTRQAHEGGIGCLYAQVHSQCHD